MFCPLVSNFYRAFVSLERCVFPVAKIHIERFGKQFKAAWIFTSKLGCLVFHLPTLRSRSDEILSLTSLDLSTLNLELGKQISGFEPRALEQLRCYDWPNNYTQFKGVFYKLATLSTGVVRWLRS